MMRPIPIAPDARLEDVRRYPGCALLLYCEVCRWARAYRPGRILARLHATGGGGYQTPIAYVARHVARDCPGCGARRWRTTLAYPADLSEREAKRLAGRYRN